MYSAFSYYFFIKKALKPINKVAKKMKNENLIRERS